MEPLLSIRLSFGRKAKVPASTYQAIKRAIPIIPCDRRVAQYAAAPHEGLTPEVVAAIRKRMIASGELPARAFSRRMEIASHG